MRALPHTRGCFVCGESNVSGLKLRFETDGRLVRARFVPRPDHVGFKVAVHGGIIATVLDEIMVWACAVPTRRFAWCVEMTVRFTNPLRPGQESVATAELTTNRRGRVFEAAAELRAVSGELIASASGKYLPIKDAALPDLVDDLVGDATGIFGVAAGPTSP